MWKIINKCYRNILKPLFPPVDSAFAQPQAVQHKEQTLHQDLISGVGNGSQALSHDTITWGAFKTLQTQG